MTTVEVKVSSEGIRVLDSLVVHADDRVVAMEIVMENDDLTVAAFGDGIFPSVMLTTNSFNFPTHTSQTKSFFKLSFPELRGFKVWSCDMSSDSLKLCFLRSDAKW